VGYIYSSKPINSEFAFFSVPVTAVIASAFQVGFGYIVNEKLALDAVPPWRKQRLHIGPIIKPDDCKPFKSL
jgi:hypothetical protein